MVRAEQKPHRHPLSEQSGGDVGGDDASADIRVLFTGIHDKDNDREVVQADKQANLLRMYEDKPIYFDNWDIDIYYTEKFWDVDQVERME